MTLIRTYSALKIAQLQQQLAAAQQQVTQQAETIADLTVALETMLRSAIPNPRDHPTMMDAWATGRAALAKAKEKQPDPPRSNFMVGG